MSDTYLVCSCLYTGHIRTTISTVARPINSARHGVIEELGRFAYVWPGLRLLLCTSQRNGKRRGQVTAVYRDYGSDALG